MPPYTGISIMSEFVKFISPEVFESGLERRLLVGQVAVGNVCKIRVEDVYFSQHDKSVRYVEATISITDMHSKEDGSTVLDYTYEASRMTDVVTGQEDFNVDSVSINRTDGVALRSYLSDGISSDMRSDQLN